MKHPYSQLGSSLLLCSLLGLYAPTYAEQAASATAEAAAKAEETASPEAAATATTDNSPDASGAAAQAEADEAAEAETTAFELKYKINDGEEQTVTADINQPFMVLLNILKASIAEASKTPNTPVKTEVMLPYPEEMAESVQEELPNLDLETRVGADKKGTTKLAIEAFESEIENKEENTEGKLTWMGLTGNLTYTGDLQEPTADVKVPGLSIDMGKEGSFKLEALSFSGTMNQHFEPLKMDFKLPIVNFNSEEANFVVDSLTATVNMEEKTEGLQLGTAEVKLKELKVDAEEQVALKDFSINSDAQMQDKDLVKYLAKFNIGQIVLPEEAQAATNGLNDLKFKLEIGLSNIDAMVMAGVHKTLRQLKSQGMNEQMMGLAILSKLMEAGPALLPKSPKISIPALDINTNQGNITGHLNLSYDGKQAFSMEHPEKVMQALIGDAKLQIAKGLLKRLITAQVSSQMPADAGANAAKAPKPEEMADMQISALMQQKLLVDSGETYTLEANMKAGKLMVNGQEMPLPF